MGVREPAPPISNSGVPTGAHSGRGTTLDHEIAIAFGRDNRDNHPKAEWVSIQWLAERWRMPDTRRGKLTSAEYHALDKTNPEQKKRRDHEKNGENFAAAEFGGDGKRLGENIKSLTAFVLDFDSGRTSRHDIEQRLAGLTCLAYTSYSHRPESPHWRAVVPYTHPIRPDQHRRVFEHFQHLFDGDLDPSCAKPAQIYFTPACPHDAADQYEMFCHDGALFDPEDLPGGSDTDQPDSEGGAESPDSADVEKELARLKDALAYLDPDPRDQWIRVGMAIKHDLNDAGMATWLEWSQRSPKFTMADAVGEWQTLKPKRGDDAVTLATVYYFAREAGWKPPAPDGVPAEIAEVNKEYFIVPYGGKVFVCREIGDPENGQELFQKYSRQDFQLLFANRRVLVDQGCGKTAFVPLAKVWLEHPARREYDGIIFAPLTEVPVYYNLWRGFAVKPKQGSWKRMRWHMLYVLCRGDRRLYRYLINWMAYAVQHPNVPAEVAVVLRGGRGAGKGVFARSFGKLFGPHYLQITQSRHLTGNFNRHLQHCVLLFADEAFWAGDKQGEGVLKGLVTELTIPIEPKFVDVVTGRNCLHIIMASNSDWVVPAGPDERRFFVLDVDDARKQDPTYFNPLYAEMDDAGPAAMLYDLQCSDAGPFCCWRLGSAGTSTLPSMSVTEGKKAHRTTVGEVGPLLFGHGRFQLPVRTLPGWRRPSARRRVDRNPSYGILARLHERGARRIP